MTPEERRRLRREKVLKRSHISDKELSNSIMNKQTTQFLNKAEKVVLTKQEQNCIANNTQINDKPKDNVEKQIKAKKFNKFKGIILMLCGIFSSVYNIYMGKQHQNIFVLFLLLDIIFIFSFSNLKLKIDREKYDNRLTGFIDFITKISFMFDLIDDLSCFFIPFLLSSSLMNFIQIN